MKIAMFTDSYEPQVNGVVKSIKWFSEELRKRKHVVHIFCPKSKNIKDTKYVHRLISRTFRKYPEYKIGFPSPNLKSSRMINKIKPDIIHIQTPITIGLVGLGIGKLFDIPIIGSYHTLLTGYSDMFIKNSGETTQRFIEKYTKHFFNRCDAVIVPSTPIKKMLRKSGVRKKIYIIPTGRKLPKKKKVKKFKIPTILHVGRICNEKRIDMILYEFKELLNYKDARLIITSDGPAKKDLMKLSETLEISDKVKFTGYLSDSKIEELYRKSHIFVSASDTETQGIVLWEAFAFGCPVVVRDALGFKDMAKHKYNSLTFKRKGFHKQMLKILENKKLREKIEKNGYKTAQEYTIESMTDRLEKAYLNLLK